MQGRPQSSAHAIDLSTPISVSLVLNRDPSVEAAFDQFLADQQTPGSPLYHQWLTPQQVGSLFGPTAHDLAALTSWLTSQGLKVDSIAPSGVIVHASGSAAIVGNAFHTSFAMFDPIGLTADGHTAAPRLSAVSEPSIPSALTPLVSSIQGLAAPEVFPLNHATPMQGAPVSSSAGSSTGVRPMFTNGSAPPYEYFVTPGDFSIIFDIFSVYGGGNTGATIGTTPQRVAVIGESRVVDTDITEFEQYTGQASATPTVVIPTGATDPGTTANGLQSEATLDVDRVIGTAPGAGVDLVIAKDSATEGGIFIAMDWNVSHLLDPIMTISFGGCEASNGLSNTNFIDTLAKTGAAEGITTLVSSGDSGAAGCDTSFVAAPATQAASINFICSSTYVTCVGGTEFNDSTNPSTYWGTTNQTGLVSALSYIPEGAWNEPSSTNGTTTTYAPAASGGGVSIYIAKPSWQTGTGVPSGSFRYVPDVSFPAAAHDGYFACLAYNGGNCANNHFEVFSGTSAAAPGVAGVVALINTKIGTSAGNINPLLYAVAASTPSAFHDTTVATSGVTGCAAATPSMCNNSTPGPSTLTGGLSGYLLTTGFDEVTGLGSFDVAKFLTAAVSTSTLTSTTLAITPPAAITVGQLTSFTATLTPATGSTGTPTGTVQFYSNGVGVGTAVSISANKATSPSQSFATAGTYTITAKYSGDNVFATSTAPGVSLVVNASTGTGSFTLAATPSSITSAAGASPAPTTLIQATSTNNFAGTVNLSCSIAYAGTGTASNAPTCSLASSSVMISSTQVSSVVLTVNSVAASTIPCPAVRTKTVAHTSSWLNGSAGVVLAGLLLVLPFRKRRSLRSLAIAAFLIVGLASLSGCGGNGSTTLSCTPIVTPGSTTGPYTITVTGTSGSITQTATVALTIN
jgi:subtilase family serine protease